MQKTIDFIITLQPAIALVIGLFLPYLNNQLKKIIDSDKYKIAKKTYDQIDPQLLENLGGKVRFLELIQSTIKATSDKQLTYKEVQHLTKLVIRDFNLDKALGK